MIHGHGGNIFALARQLGCAPEALSDMSSNINPLGPPPGLTEHLAAHLADIRSLPDVDAAASREALALLLDLDPDWILGGAGTTRFIYSACRALACRRALIVGPTYADYADACRQAGIEPDFFLTRPEDDFRLDLAALEEALPGHDTLFLCAPNNPTGCLTPLADLAALARRHSGIRFVIDASYLPFAEPQLAGSLRPLAGPEGPDNALALWSGSKIFAMPGLRAGFLVARPEMLEPFRQLAEPWPIGTPGQEAMRFLADNRDAAQAFVEQTHAFVREERERLHRKLAAVPGLHLVPTSASFTLIRLPPGLRAEEARQAAMLKERLLIRNCANFHGLDDSYIRMALKGADDNARFADLLLGLCAGL